MPGLGHSERGSALPEALMAVLVVTAGLRGLALLQLESLQLLQAARWHLAAVAAAVDVAESLRTGYPDHAFLETPPAGLPGTASVQVGPAGNGPGTTSLVSIEWPGHDALPSGFALAVVR